MRFSNINLSHSQLKRCVPRLGLLLSFAPASVSPESGSHFSLSARLSKIMKICQELFLNNTTGLLATPKSNKIIPKNGPRHFWQPLLLFLLLFHVHLDVISMQELFLHNTTGLLATPQNNQKVLRATFGNPSGCFCYFFMFILM